MAYHGVRFFSREVELCMTRIGNGLESTEWAERALQRMDEMKRTCASCSGPICISDGAWTKLREFRIDHDGCPSPLLCLSRVGEIVGGPRDGIRV